MANIMKERWIRKVREYDGNDRIYKKIQRKNLSGTDSELLETDPGLWSVLSILPLVK